MLLLCLSTSLTVLSGMDGSNALYASVSCLSNVGPAIGDMGTLGNFNGITAMSKFILCLDMFVGRLEIYPVLAAIMMVFRIGKR